MKDSTTPLPAPAGEPEMPETVGYLLTGSRTFVDDVVRTESAAFRRRTERNDGTVAEPLVRLSAARAYGDARAEHARRVAMEEAALIVDAEEDNAREERYHPGLVGTLSACAEAIRAAAPPQGEQT